jgi:protein-S-isoprenylcysteine O-methyltransferase Ste14
VRQEPDTTTRLGGWLFRHRTSLPLPFAAAILGLRVGPAPASTGLVAAGVAVTVAGEILRLWGVHHIGSISRTRADRLGPLVASGPFALVRNPLYLGNIAIWVGFALTARLVWLAPVILILLGLEYHAIVRWEERLLESRLGEDYRNYASRVPRWTPRLSNRGARRDRRERESHQEAKKISAVSAVSAVNTGGQSWNATLFSERGTLLAIAAGYLLLYLRARF